MSTAAAALGIFLGRLEESVKHTVVELPSVSSVDVGHKQGSGLGLVGVTRRECHSLVNWKNTIEGHE